MMLLAINKLLRWIGHRTPDIPYLRAVPNRILKPLHRKLGLGSGVVDVLGFKMFLEPHECVDGNLWFAPHLYDRAETKFLLQRFPTQGVFLDIGSNIGFWSLLFAYSFPEAFIYAIEANPATYDILLTNIKLNNFKNITPINVGVSNGFGELPLFCNDIGNRGGDTFGLASNSQRRKIMVKVKPLAAILADLNVQSITLMKLDIEGFEEKVLLEFFRNSPRALWPLLICSEISHVPLVGEYLRHNGYHLAFSSRENAVFELIRESP